MTDSYSIYHVTSGTEAASELFEPALRDGISETVYQAATDIDALDGPVPLWGAPESSETWGDLRRGDFLLFDRYQFISDETRTIYAGRVLFTEENESLCQQVLDEHVSNRGANGGGGQLTAVASDGADSETTSEGTPDDVYWSRIIYLAETFEVALPLDDINKFDAFEKTNTSDPFIEFSDDDYQRIQELHGGVSEYITSCKVSDHFVGPIADPTSAPSETTRTTWTFLCGEETCQECFSEELFGYHSGKRLDISPGDNLILYDHDEEVVFGPFTAASKFQSEIDMEAFDGEYPMQIEVSWQSLYRLPKDDFPYNIRRDEFEPEEGDAILNRFTQRGTPIQIAENGKPTPIDEEDNTPEDDSVGENDQGHEDPLRDVIRDFDSKSPLPDAEILRRSRQPGEVLLRNAIAGELRPELYREALAALVAGKNIIFHGPPGSGKTRCARRLGHALTADMVTATANAEWSYQQVIGGHKPVGDGFEPDPGVMTEAVAECTETLHKHEHPSWLLIDELNRANLDEAFGEVFTALDISHRDESTISFADQPHDVPLAFRILATMNNKDQAQLFALGYAFRRRFALIEVPPLYHDDDTDVTIQSVTSSLNLPVSALKTRLVIEQAVVSQFKHQPICSNDSQFGMPVVNTLFDPAGILDTAVDELTPPGGETSFDFIDAMLYFVSTLAETGVAEVGQGIIIDMIKFILAYQFLFPERIDWDVVDKAVVTQLVPQLESYMSTLRRSETLIQDQQQDDEFATVIQAARDVGLARTVASLESAKEEYSLL